MSLSFGQEDSELKEMRSQFEVICVVSGRMWTLHRVSTVIPEFPTVDYSNANSLLRPINVTLTP